MATKKKKQTEQNIKSAVSSGMQGISNDEDRARQFADQVARAVVSSVTGRKANTLDAGSERGGVFDNVVKANTLGESSGRMVERTDDYVRTDFSGASTDYRKLNKKNAKYQGLYDLVRYNRQQTSENRRNRFMTGMEEMNKRREQEAMQSAFNRLMTDNTEARNNPIMQLGQAQNRPTNATAPISDKDRYEQNKQRIAQLTDELNDYHPFYDVQGQNTGMYVQRSTGRQVSPVEYKRLQSELEGLQAENRIYDRTQGVIDKYAPYQAASDFAEKSVSRTGPTMQGVDKLGAYLQAMKTNNGEQIGIAMTQIDAPGTVVAGNRINAYDNILREGEMNNWRFLEDGEIQTYYYLMNTQGQQAADKYLNDMSAILGQRWVEKQQEDYESQSTLGKVLYNAATFGTNFTAGIAATIDTMKEAATGQEMNPYSYGRRNLNFTQAIRSQTAQDIDTATGGAGIGNFTFGDMYQALMSSVDSYLGAAGMGRGYTAVMGLGAAQSKAQDLYNKGASEGQIVAGSILSGVAEAAFEYISLDKFLNTTDTRTMGQLVKQVLQQAGVEASEEMATEVANTFIDVLNRRTQSDWEQRLQSGGVKSAFLETLSEVIDAGAGGFISGGAMSGFGSLGNYAAYNAEMTDLGRRSYVNGAYDVALDYAQNQDNKVSDRTRQLMGYTQDEFRSANDIGKFVESVNEDINETQTKEAIRESLEQAGRNADEAVVNAVYDQMKNNADIVTGRGTANVSDVDIEGVEEAAEEKAQQERSKAVAQFDSNVRKNSAQTAVDEALKNVSETEHTTLKNEAGEVEDVDIASVESIGKDGMMLKLKDGRTVNSNDIAYGTEQEAILYESARNLGMDAKTANSVIHGYDAQLTTPIQYMYGMNEAINYGKLGVKQDVINSRGYYADLTPAQQKYGWNLGQSIAEADVKAAQEKMLKSTMRTVAKDNGHIHFMTGTEFKNMTDIQKESIGAVARTVQNITHNEVYLYETVVSKDGQRHLAEDIKPGVKGMRKGDVVTANGFYDGETGNIYLDINAGNNGEGTILWTFSHEMTHWAKDLNRKAYNDLVSFLSTSYMEKGVDINTLARAKQAKLGLSFDAAMDEVIADSMERMFTDTNLEEKLYQFMNKNRTLFEKMRDAILRLFKRIQSLYSKVDPQTTEGELVHLMGDKLEKMSDLFASLLAGAGEVNTAFDMYNGNVIEDGGYVAERTELINGQEVTLDANTSTEGTRVEMMTDGAVSPGGQKLFQYRAMEHDMPQYRELLMKHGTTAEECDLLFGMVERIMDKVKSNLDALDYAWEQDIDDRSFNPVKPNSDPLYKKSVDFSTLCRKRILQQLVQFQLQTALDRALTREESIAIRDELMKIQQQGKEIEVACALCYVESARMKSPVQIQKFLDDRETILKEYFTAKDKENSKQKRYDAEMKARQDMHDQYADDIAAGKMKDPMAYTTTKTGKVVYTPLNQLPGAVKKAIQQAKKDVAQTYQYTAEEQEIVDAAMNMTVTDFTTPDGLAALVKNYPRLYDAYISYVRNATHSKGIEGDIWWRFGDSFSISDDLITAMNTENGLRSQSWSDFQVIHTLDYIAAIIELSARKAKMQVYSKVPDYIKLMGLTGQMINMSLIPATVFNGILEYDGVEGMPFKKALELRNKYHATAGTICIGISYDHIKMLLDSADIDYVIPYHHSGMSKLVRHAMNIPTWESFQDIQEPKKLDGAKARENAKRFGVSLMSENNPSWHKEPTFSQWIHPADIRQTANTYNALSDSELTAEEKALKKKYGKMFGTFIAMRQAADNYKKMCARRGLAPQFSYGKGDFSNEDGYWKLLIDRKMIDNVTGEFIEQQAVKPIFNESDIMEILDDEIARYPGVKADQEYATRTVVEKFLSGKMNDEINAIQKVTGVAQTAIDDVTKVSILSTADDTTFNDSSVKKSDRNQQYIEPDSDGFLYSQRVTDKDLLDFLNNQDSVKVYRAMQVIDGKLYPPMNAYQKDENGKRVLLPPTEIGVWEQSEERPDLIDPKTGKFKLDKGATDAGKGSVVPAAYNPYIHTSLSMLNDQFSSAWDRSNLVVVEGHVPSSELTSGYKAQFAKDAVGKTKWHSGPVATELNKLGKPREVILSRYFMPDRIVPNAEAAESIADVLKSTTIPIPENTVSPGLRAELEKQGVTIGPPKGLSKSQIDSHYSRTGTGVKYSERDTSGRQLSPAQQEYFRDSKVRDENGNLLTVYHGTDAEFTVFDRTKGRSTMDIQGSFFSPWDIDAEGYGSNVQAYYLNITNPASEALGYKALNKFKGQNNAGVKAREYLESLGYDGVNNSDEEYIAFYPEQIKRIDNLNPTSDPDIRFSERNPEAVETLREANRALQRQVETLKGDIHNLIDLLGVQAKTKGRGVISDSSLKAVAKKILADNGVTARNQTDFLRALENVYDTMRTAKNISYEDIREVAQPAVDWIMKHLPGSGQLSEEAQQLFSYLKGKRFYVSPAVKAELASAYGDYNTFRKSLMGRVTLTTTDTNATSLDSVWGELSSQFPWLFQADTPDVDQWQTLYDTIQQMKNSGAEEEQAYFGNLMANDILSQIYNGYWDVSTLYNDDAKYKKEINELKYKHQQQIAKLKQYYNEKIADLRGKLKKEMQESMTAYRQRVSEREQKLRQDFRDRQQAQRQGRESTDFRRKIRRIADELKGRLLNPTERRYVPAALVNGVIDIANEIDTTWFDQNTASARKFRSGLEALSRLRDAYEELRTSQNYDWSSEYSEEFSEKIKWLAKAVGDTPVRNMTHDQLSDVYDIMHDLQAMVQFATKQISDTESITNYRAAMEVIDEMREVKKLGLNKSAISAFFRNYLTNPLRAINEMTGYNPDSRLGKLITGINEGIRKGDYWAMNTRKSVEAVRDENVKAFNDAVEKPFDFGLYDINGNPLKISKMQAMQLVMTWAREQSNPARQHLQANGTVIPDVDRMRSGDYDNARDKGQKIGSVTQQMIDQINSRLSDWDRRFMAAAREVFDKSTQAINDTTMQTKGRILATEKNYIPYEVDKDFVQSELENIKYDATIEGAGMLKAVKAYAPQALIIRGLNTIVDKHINDVAKVYGLMVPVRNFNKVWNTMQTKEDGGASVKSAVRDTWQKAGMELIQHAIEDVQGPRRTQTSKIVQKIKSGFVTSTLASNISVWMKQAASYPTAGSILSGSSLMKGLGRYAARKSSEVWAEIDKYTAQHYKRRQGLSSQELGDFNQTEGWVRRLSDKMGKLSPMNWIQAMDVATTAALWEATKAEVEKRGIKKDTEQYWQEVTNLYDEVIEKTQPMYDPLHRAEVTKNPALGTIIMFQTQPIQNSGILREATMEYKYAKKQYGAKSNQAKAAARNFRSAILSQMASHLTFTAMTILANALMHKMNPYRDKETGKVTAESVLTQFLSMFGQNYFNAVVPVIGSYAISAMDKISGASRYDVFSDAVVDKLNTTMDALNKMFTQPTMENLLNAGADIAGYFGVPAKNAMNIINGARLHIMDAIKGELGSFEAGFEPTQSQEAYRIYNALEEGDTEEAERLANAYEEAHPNSTKWTTRITGMIEDKLAAGEIDQTEAERLLAEYVGMDNNDIDKWRYKQENGTTTGYSVYNDFYEAVSTGKNLKSVIKDYTDSGVKTSTLASQITRNFKSEYVAASKAEQSRMKGYLLNAYVALGYDRDKKSKDIDNWLKD